MALATPSDPGLLDEEAIIGSPGCVTSLCAKAVLPDNDSNRQEGSPMDFHKDVCIS